MGLNSTKTSYNNAFTRTATTNPYAYSKTDNSGTISGFQDGTALQSVYNFVNNSIDSLLNEYMNPNLNSITNRSQLNSFANSLNQQTKNNLENSIINPLSNRNMIRSSQATDLYKNLANQNIASIADYTNNLLTNSQANTAKMLSNLLSYYMLGANYLTDMQNHSLNASSNGNTAQTSKGNSNELAKEVIPIVLELIASFV